MAESVSRLEFILSLQQTPDSSITKGKFIHRLLLFFHSKHESKLNTLISDGTESEPSDKAGTVISPADGNLKCFSYNELQAATRNFRHGTVTLQSQSYCRKCHQRGRFYTLNYKSSNLSELDGLFKRMLLLKKKKYAAVKEQIRDGKVYKVIVRKGLGMVRRDWSLLSKETGDFCLEQILSELSWRFRREQIPDVTWFTSGGNSELC